MIVVIGSAAFRPNPATAGRAVGLAPEIAAAAAAAGAAVELLARIGDDGAGEELLLALARADVGHLAVLRDPARPTALAPGTAEPPGDGVDAPLPPLLADAEEARLHERPGSELAAPAGPALEPADLSLGLRYLRDFGVVVAVEPLAAGGAAVVTEAASFAGAAVVVVAAPGLSIPAEYAAATVLEAPAEDPGGPFARLVGGFAAALDRGVAPRDAFRGATVEGGWEMAAD